MIRIVIGGIIIGGNIDFNQYFCIGDGTMSEFFWIFRIKLKRIGLYAGIFIKWLIIASITGALGGAVGTLFNKGISYATSLRHHFPWLLLLMPFLGLIIVLMYEKANLSRDGGTNLILHSIRHLKGVPIIIAP